MTKQTQEALKMAIEAMEMAMEADWELNKSHVFNILHSITVCKEALEQPAQEPEYVYVNPVTKDMYYLTKAEQSAPTIELKPANIAKARDEIYYAWRKYWAWGIPSKDGEAVFNANGDGFLAGWLACEQALKEKNT